MQDDHGTGELMAKKTRETTHLRLRLDPIRLAKLEKAAEKNGLTLTGEIVRRLDESFSFPVLIEEFAERLAEKLGSTVTVKIGDAITKYSRPREGDEK
jgi:hypothetical protein